MKKDKYILLIIALLYIAPALGQVRVKVQKTINFPSDALDIYEAGMDFTNSISSLSGVELSVTYKYHWQKGWGYYNWVVGVHKYDIFWPPELQVQIRRTGSGEDNSTFTGWISGGTNYQTITNMPNTFITGGGEITKIPTSFQVNNLSVLTPAGDYETIIYFTIYEY